MVMEDGERKLLSEVSEVKVGVARLNGNFETLAARLEESQERQDRDIIDLERQQREDLEPRLVSLEKWQNRMMGAAALMGTLGGILAKVIFG